MKPFMIAILFLFILHPYVMAAQPETPADTGKIEIVQDYKIKELVQKHVDINAKAPVKGYRVKIHFGADKTKARDIKAKFLIKYPDVPAYEKYDQPNFNIRVGDFRTKLEAYRFYKMIQPDFPSAFIVQDEIELPPLGQQESKTDK